MASTTTTLLKKLVNGKSLQRVLDSEAGSFAEIPLSEYLRRLCEERDVACVQAASLFCGNIGKGFYATAVPTHAERLAIRNKRIAERRRDFLKKK